MASFGAWPFPSCVSLALSLPNVPRAEAAGQAEARPCCPFPGSPASATAHALSPATELHEGCRLTLCGTAALPRCLGGGEAAGKNSTLSWATSCFETQGLACNQGWGAEGWEDRPQHPTGRGRPHPCGSHGGHCVPSPTGRIFLETQEGQYLVA